LIASSTVSKFRCDRWSLHVRLSLVLVFTMSFGKFLTDWSAHVVHVDVGTDNGVFICVVLCHYNLSKGYFYDKKKINII